YEVLAAHDFRSFHVAQCKSQVAERRDDRSSVGLTFSHEYIGILSRVGKAQQNGAGFAKEKVLNAVTRKAVANFLCLPIFKRAHSPTNLEGSLHTISGIRPSCQTRGIAHRRAPACRSG